MVFKLNLNKKTNGFSMYIKFKTQGLHIFYVNDLKAEFLIRVIPL
jgi:hypothetical protein